MKMLKFYPLIVLTAMLFFEGKAQTVDSKFVDGRIYLKIFDSENRSFNEIWEDNPFAPQLEGTYGIQKIEKAFRTAGVQTSRVYRIEFSQHHLIESLIQQLEQFPQVEYAEKAPIMKLDFTPNDYSASEQYYLDIINATQAWDIERGDGSVIIAVVDNGVRTTHSDLAGNLWVNTGEIPGNSFDDDLNGYTDDYHGADVADGDGNPNPPNSPNTFTHGTHVAGLAGAQSNNGNGIASLAYDVRIMCVKASPDNSDGQTLTASYEGVDYAIAEGADIINMSFGGATNAATWNILLNQAAMNDVILIASAGNDNNQDPSYPAAYSQVISVAATDQNDNKAGFSNYNNNVDFCAPGVSMKSTFSFNDNDYGNLTGTSMSAPLVSSLAALLKSLNPNFTATQVRNFIANGCETFPDMNNPTFQGKLGAGRINAYHSLLLATGQSVGLLEEHHEVLLWPNPSSNEVRISGLSGQQIILQNASGMSIKTLFLSPQSTLHIVDLSDCAPGLYFLTNERGDFRKKLVKR